jgi:hypothetical protein
MSVNLKSTLWVLLLCSFAFHATPPASAEQQVVETISADGVEINGASAPATGTLFTNPDSVTVIATVENTEALETLTFEASGLRSDLPGTRVRNNEAIVVTAAEGSVQSADFAESGASVAGIRTAGGLENSGDITVTATGGDATAGRGDETAFAWAEDHIHAAGIDADEERVENGGDITVAATGGVVEAGDEAYGDVAAIGIETFGAVQNVGDIQATAAGSRVTAARSAGPEVLGWAEDLVYAAGIETSNAVTNEGRLTVTATGNTAVSGENAQNGALADARGDTSAVGIHASGAVVNHGAIRVTATGGTVTALIDAQARTVAEGIRGGGAVENTGEITVTATGSTATALSGNAPRSQIQAVGIRSGADVHNSGSIRVTASSPAGAASEAYGIRMEGDGVLSNTAPVRAYGDTAHQVVVDGGDVTLETGYTVSLEGNPSAGALLVTNGGTLDLAGVPLSVSGATHRWGAEYPLFAIDDPAVVSGAFTTDRPMVANPNVTAIYNDGGTASAANDTVSLRYTPTGSAAPPAMEAVQQSVTGIFTVNEDHNLNRLMRAALSRDQGTVERGAQAGDSEGFIYVQPLFFSMENDSSPVNFDADLIGFSAGYSRLSENFLWGAHLGYGQLDTDFSGGAYDDSEEDLNLFTAGIGGTRKWGGWALRVGATAHWADHAYSGMTGTAFELREKASYDSYGVHSLLMGGYLFEAGRHAFLPEAGIHHSWIRREKFHTEVDQGSSWETTFAEEDINDLRIAASLRWLARFEGERFSFVPSAAVGMKQLITDDTWSVSQSVAGEDPVRLDYELDETVMTLSASTQLKKDRLEMTLAYDGELGDQTDRHSFMVRIGISF